MNIVNKLTLRHMKLNKKRTIVTTIAIVIAVAMLTAVSTISYSILDYFGRTEMKYYANMHVKFESYNYGDTEKIVDKLDVEEYIISKVIGNYKVDIDQEDKTENTESIEGTENSENLENTEYIEDNARDIYVQVTEVENRYYDMMNINLSSGRFPENNREVVLSYQMNSILGGKKVGDTVKFGNSEYTVVGISKDIDYESKTIEYDQGIIFPVWTLLDMDSLSLSDKVNGYFRSSIISNSYTDDIFELEDELSSDTVAYPNWNVLTYYGQSKYTNVQSVMTSFKAVLIAIIVISSIALISNAFIISISERSRYLGMLSSVGATKKQKRMSVYFEGLIEGVIGIVLGIIAGIGGIFITFKCIQPLLDSLTQVQVELKVIVNWDVIITSVVISLITIAVSAYIPARRASKITAIDAIRQSKDIKISGKTVKTSKITRKLFGFEGELALKNLKRNKKRYRITIFSLFISLTLFLVVYSYVSFIQQQYISVYGGNIDFDVCISPNGMGYEYDEMGNIIKTEGDEGVNEIVKNIEKSENIDDMSVFSLYNIYENKYYFDRELDFSECKDVLSEKYENFIDERDLIESTKYEIITSFIVMDEKSLSKYLENYGYNYDDFVSKTNNIVIVNNINKTVYHEDEYAKYGGEVFDKSYEGNNIRCIATGYSDEDKEDITRILEFNAYAIIDDIPFGMSAFSNSLVFIVTPEFVDNYRMMLSDKYAVFKTNDNKMFVEELTKIMSDNNLSEGEDVYIENVIEMKKEMDNLILLISVFVYGFIILMTLICVANIFNTISTSFSLRKREFAMLRSVGMTSKAFHKMIAYESAFYGLKALLFGLPLSTVIILYLMKSITGPFVYELEFPWFGYVIAIFGVFFTIGITMLYSARKVKNQNVIDTLKDENIS